MASITPKVVHVIAPYSGNSPLRHRQQLFLETVARASRQNVVLLAASRVSWESAGWEPCSLKRNASELGEPSDKPFLKDLYDLAFERAAPDDWLLYSNIDCSFAPDLYQDLLSRRCTIVEYERQDVEGDPQTLDELFSNPRKIYPTGIDAVAIRAKFYGEIRDSLPDFVIGEPHWDTIYSGIFRQLIPVQRDCVRLFHPKHDQVWNLAKPNAAGRHNHELFVESLNRGYADKTLITEVPDHTDTAVVVAAFGSDPSRVVANTAGIRGQLEQDLYADIYLVELLVGDTQSSYPQDLLSSVRHLPVRTSETCLDMFQKEALLNYGWRAALTRGRYNYFIFVDADVYSDEKSWFRQIRRRLQQDPARAVQGWCTVRDTIDPCLHHSSVGAAFVLGQPSDLPLNPGICWGLHRQLLEMGDGLNPYCLATGGDSAFVAEYLNTSQVQYDPWLCQWSWFREIERELPFRAQLDCVPVDLVHVHHGYLKERNYDAFHYAMEALRPLSELAHTNAEGLLEWNDPECVERAILRQRDAMGTRADVDELLERFSYPRFVRPKPLKNTFLPKALFQLSGHQPPRLLEAHAVHSTTRSSGLKIFDPEQVYRKDFPFSWCDGVANAENSTYVPIVDAEEAAILVLDGKPDAPCVVCALPLQPSWQPVDLMRYRTLRFAIRLSVPAPKDLYVSLVSQGEDDREHSSCELSLRERSLEPGPWKDLSVPLEQFVGDGFDLRSVRLVKFVAHQSCRFELAKIYLTD